jgi:glyoxylase-like metal-dependent hydrolase (beta-lactamase superfamily II)
VFAFSPNTDGVDCLVRDGDTVKMGDAYFEVIHTPGHSSDSICLYNRPAGVLFAGDTPVVMRRQPALMSRSFWRQWRRCAPATSGRSISGTALR